MSTSTNEPRLHQRAFKRPSPTRGTLHHIAPPHDLPPSSRSPSPSKQGAIFESQRRTMSPANIASPAPMNGQAKSMSAPASPESSIPARRPRYGKDQRMRNLSVSSDEWALGLDRVDSPGPPSFGNKAGRSMAGATGYGGYPQPGEQGEMGDGGVKKPVVVHRFKGESRPVVSAAPSVESLSGQVQMKSKRAGREPGRDRREGAAQSSLMQGEQIAEAVETRSPPRLSKMPPPPVPSPPPLTSNTKRTPALHVIRPFTSTTASFARQSYDNTASNVTDPSTSGRPVSVRSAGSQRAFADVAQMMQDGRASRESVGARSGQREVADGPGGVKQGSAGRPPKKRQNLIGPAGVLGAMASKPSFARLREIATASKASLSESLKKNKLGDLPMVTSEVCGAEAPDTLPAAPKAGTRMSAAHDARTAGAPGQPHDRDTGVQRQTTILRPAPLPPLGSSSPSATRFAPPTISPSRSLANRGSGLLANTAIPAARSSADALFAPAATSMQDLRTNNSAAPSPVRSQTGSSPGGGWLHNPHVDFGSAPNLPLSMRLSQLGTRDASDGIAAPGTGQQYQTPQGQPGQGGLNRSLSVREDGTVEIPRFKRKELNLDMVPGGMGRRVLWMSLWGWCIVWTLTGLFFDVNILYMLVQCVSPGLSTGSGAENSSGWVFAVAAYGTCMLISIVVVWLGWGVWYESWRKWRLPQPPIEPIHTSLPASLYVALSCFPHFCFFLHTRLSMLGTRYATDLLPETAALGLQTIPSLLPILPRASIAVILYVTFYARSAGVPLRGDKDEAFWASSGRLTDYARGVVLGFMVLSAARLAVALLSGVVIFAFSKSRYDGPVASSNRLGRRTTSWRHRNRPSLIPLSRTKYEGHGTADTDASPHKGKSELHDPSTPQRKEKHLKRDPSQTVSPSKGWTAESDSSWGWRERGRNRLQDAYELCMLRPSRRRSARMLRTTHGSTIHGAGHLMGYEDGAEDGTPSRRDGGEVEKLVSPAESVTGNGALLSPTPQSRGMGHGGREGAAGDAMSPTRSASPGKRATTPTIRFADEGVVPLTNSTAAHMSAQASPPKKANSLADSRQSAIIPHKIAVNGYQTEAASSTATLRPEYDPARPDSGVLPQGRFSPLALDPRLSPALPTGGLSLGAPIKGSMSDPQMGKQDARAGANASASVNGTGRGTRPKTADKSTSTTKISHADPHAYAPRPWLSAQNTRQSHTSLTSRESLSSHEMFYTPMSGTPMPSQEELMVRQGQAGGSAFERVDDASKGEEAGRLREGNDDGVERLADSKSGSATPTAIQTSASHSIASPSAPNTAATVHDPITDSRLTHMPRPSTASSSSSHTEDGSDSTALLTYDHFGYPSYPSASSRSRRKSPTKRHYEKEIRAGGGDGRGGSQGRVKQVISSPSLKNLRDRAGSFVGRRAD